MLWCITVIPKDPLIRVEHGTPMVGVLKRLLHLARQAGIRPRLLLLDRGFYSVAVIRYLYQPRYPFVMPVVRRGRSTDDPRGPSGTQVFAEQAQWLAHLYPDQCR